MKKILLISVIVLYSVTGLFAQKGLSFGLRAIPTLNWVSMTDGDSLYSYESSGTKLGIGFGPSVRYKFSDNFNVDVSGIFTWQKFGINQTNETTNPEVVDRTENFKVQFLQIPLNFNGQFDVAQDFQALINFGVGTGIKLNASRVLIDNQDPQEFSSEYKTTSVLNFVDFYLTAGAGAVYNIEDNLHLSLTVQYNNGIIDGWLNNKNDNVHSTIGDLSVKHKNVAFSLAFYIDL
ncbi:MAG: PorT family protein [Bacteroidales bacterium]|nr:PorT family protein [Bacteroidales bacterium]